MQWSPQSSARFRCHHNIRRSHLTRRVTITVIVTFESSKSSNRRSEAGRCDAIRPSCYAWQFPSSPGECTPAHHRHVALLNRSYVTPASQKKTRRAVEGSYTLLLSLPIEPQQQADGDPQPLDIRTGNPSSHLVAGRGLLAKVIERRIPAIGLRSETAIPSQQSSPLCIRHWIVGPQSVGRK